MIALILLIVLILALTSDDKPATVYPAQLADCIAEQAYVNPMNDKFKELENAIAICYQQKGADNG